MNFFKLSSSPKSSPLQQLGKIVAFVGLPIFLAAAIFTILQVNETQGIDTDSDGIEDSIDLDDDNDGILDTQECYTTLVDLTSSPIFLNGTQITGLENLDVNDVLLFTNAVVKSDGIILDMRIVFDEITSDAEYSVVAEEITIRPYNPSSNDHIIMTIDFLESGTNTVSVNGIRATFKDIDSGSNDDFTEIIGFTSTLSVVLGDNLIPGSYQAGGPGSLFTNYFYDPSTVGNANNWVNEGNSLTTNEDHWLEVDFGIQSSVQVAFGVTGSEGMISTGRDLLISNISILDCPDTDRDGIDDYVDSDSDNDGIPDLVEAGGVDADGDGRVDDATDSDGDGLANTFETADGSTSILFDTDGDGITDNDRNSDGDTYPDYIDIDADNDGIVDNIEGQTTIDFVAPTGYDDDGDGFDNAYDPDCNGSCTNSNGVTTDVTAAPFTPTNTDLTDTPDYLDTDSDNDGEDDSTEAYDSDDDGTANTTPSGSDSDNDGLDDSFDNNDLVTSAIGNPNNSGQTPATFPDDDPNQSGGDRDWRDLGGSSFPVEWLSFDIVQSGSDAILDWVTAVELNSDFFEVERSVDGRLFQSIGQEKAAGNASSTTIYRFVDRNFPITSSPRLYYRIKQLDMDGKFSYSNTQELSVEKVEDLLKVGPNPVNEILNVWYPSNLTGNLSFEVFSLNGQKVYEGIIQAKEEMIEVNVANWTPGTYILKSNNQQGLKASFVVRH